MLQNPLERIRLQRAKKVLDMQQDQLRSQMRMEGEHKRSHDPYQHVIASPRSSSSYVRLPPATYKGVPIASYPKTREFWATVDFTKLSTRQLRAAADLLGVDLDGKKVALVARLQDWVNAAAIEARRKQLEKEARKRERLEASGGVFGCGNNFAGQLGLGHRDAMAMFTGFDADFAYALSADGEVFGWGGNGVAPIGHLPREVYDVNQEGDHGPLNDTFLLPRVVRSLRVEEVVSISCSRASGHVVALNSSGQCFGWGKNDFGELGLGHVRSPPAPGPQLLENLRNMVVTSVGVGHCHTVVSTNGGHVYAFGAAWGGQLGVGGTKREGIKDPHLQVCFPSPTLVSFPVPVKVSSVACGAVHTAVVTTSGHLYTFGCGDGGRLGLQTTGDVIAPTLVTALEADFVWRVTCGNWHTLCIAGPRTKAASSTTLRHGWVYAFGTGLHGQLGLGKQKQALLPTRVPELQRRKVKCIDVHVSAYHSVALGADGSVFTWGRNASGCLGRTTPDEIAPDPDVVAAVKTWGYGPVASIACGCRFTLLLASPWPGIKKEAFHDVQTMNLRRKMTDSAPEAPRLDDDADG
ncbi:hypothetical protein SPRG_05069 [Saprolegnia parasitica CBS 223.65]|uniref:SAP domain-containing protein n=1 Tax=Saprolegnia parasitica (strain CBS 223.65) TaxID=695850 RepID=A0A067CIL8_SAPPC|nr:hypothetical protein SPRG_05069 [Saprolegnia parasitica CBS 223.65]KDO30358.1 hypothetical protein SPRG_05069 [Saprolegnia parasitica CBS 223.65]|eukprot:XP_012198968.1 hypothetical protein SPRG_05069 [Saprolegnia parasitica CBS 223.65]